jgi:hypothetical protein
MAPLVPEEALPVLSTIMPLTPAVLASLVDSNIEPLLVPVEASPVRIEIWPPDEPVAVPALMKISPPTPTLPLPTVM